MNGSVILHKRRKELPPGQHPWIFSGAVARVEGEPVPGGIVSVLDKDGTFVAWGTISPASRILVRCLEWDQDVQVDEAWWRQKVRHCLDRRKDLPGMPGLDAFRLIHAEADGLPGVIADRYGAFVTLQCLSAGADRMKSALADELWTLLKPEGIYERSDSDVRGLEGLEPQSGPLMGSEPPECIEISENGYRFGVDIRGGQKTGFFLDQRENRRAVSAYAAGREVLDCFCYSGSFSVCALGAGAKSTVLVDSSTQALAWAARALEANRFPSQEMRHGNAFEILRSFRDSRRSFDLIILDPPKLAPTRSHAPKATRAYKDLNLLAMKLLRPCGVLATFSCSAGVDRELFREVLLWASVDSGRAVQILKDLGSSEDHPVRVGFPESEYLKGCICRVL